MAKITIDGKDVEISDESMSELRASLLPNGEQLIRDLEPGEYEICGKNVFLWFDQAGYKVLDTYPVKATLRSWLKNVHSRWEHQRKFESYIGKEARLITSGDIVRIMPKTGTALLDELEPGTLVAINGERCAVSITIRGSICITPLLFDEKYAVLPSNSDNWSYLNHLSEAINKPVADLVASDIVQLYPKGE